MKQIGYSFYWILTESNINGIKSQLSKRNFPFSPSECHFEGDYSYQEGIQEFLKYDDWEDNVHMTIWGTQNDQRAFLFFRTEEWGNGKLISIHIAAATSSDQLPLFYLEYINLEYLVCCFIFDNIDEGFQSRDSINWYQNNDISYKHLPLTRNRAGEIIIDVSKNAGRSEHVLGINFMAASRMYFSETIFKIMDKEVLTAMGGRSFKTPYQDLMLIDLFDIFHNSEEQIRAAQKIFLEKTELFNKIKFLKDRFRGDSQRLQYLKLI